MAWLLPLRPHTSPSLHSRPPQIIKAKGAEPEPFEIDVAQALCDLEANSNDLKAELRELYITSAKEVDVNGRKVVVIFVPFKLLKIVHKIQSRLVREVRAPPPPHPTPPQPSPNPTPLPRRRGKRLRRRVRHRLRRPRRHRPRRPRRRRRRQAAAAPRAGARTRRRRPSCP